MAVMHDLRRTPTVTYAPALTRTINGFAVEFGGAD